MIDLKYILFGFNGRINRAKYWLAAPIYLVIGFVLTFIALMTISSFYQLVGAPSDLNTVMGRLPMYVFLLPTLAFTAWAGAAMMTKRLHDRDKSGWWAVLFVVVPAVLNKVSDLMEDTAGAAILIWIALALSIWGLAETLCLKGTSGPNRFGADPRIATGSRHALA